MPKQSRSFMLRSSDENSNRVDGDCSIINAVGNVIAGVCHPKSGKFWMDLVRLTEHKSLLFKHPAGAVLPLYGPGIERCRIQKVRMAAETPIDRLLCSTA